MPTPLGLADFLHRYGAFRSATECQHFEQLTAWLEQTKPLLSDLLDRQRIELAQNAPLFNVFHLLGLARKEAVLHTPFLAGLLDPGGSHGQGHRLLASFLSKANRRGLVLPAGSIADVRWNVQAEFYAGSGEDGVERRLDLMVSCTALRYLLVIENKVDADEQDDQLARYGDWLDSQAALYTTRQLIFLTPDGREATTSGTFEPIIRLSFRTDIRDWLREFRDSAPPAPVHFAVCQYLHIIESL